MAKVSNFTVSFNVDTNKGAASFVIDGQPTLYRENLSADCIAGLAAVLGSGENITYEKPWIVRKEDLRYKSEPQL